MLSTAGMTMDLRGPHKRMKMVAAGEFFHPSGQAPALTPLSPPLLDSGLRRMTIGGPFDGMTKGCREWRMRWSGLSRIGVRDMLSYQSLMPAGAGTPRYEKRELWFGTANQHGGLCHAPPRPQRGTSPSPPKSSTALHFLIPPSTIGLQFGTFRRWRAGIEVDWRVHPGS